jgi:ABC-type microcin C transport system permease subunit YejE
MLFYTLVLFFSALRLTFATELSQNIQQVNITFSNSIRFLFDTDGNQVDAYGSKISCKGYARPKLSLNINKKQFSVWKGVQIVTDMVDGN